MAGCCSALQRWLSLFLYMVGLILSGYSYYVHMAKKADENYVALCDFDETISCSKVFTSKYGKGFGLVELITGEEEHPLNQPNSLYGIIFYATLGLLYICSGSSNFLANLQFYSFILPIFLVNKNLHQCSQGNTCHLATLFSLLKFLLSLAILGQVKSSNFFSLLNLSLVGLNLLLELVG